MTSRRHKRIIYLEAAVPETRDDVGERVERLFCLVLAAMSWRGDFDAPAILALSGEFEDYLHAIQRDVDDAELIEKIKGK